MCISLCDNSDYSCLVEGGSVVMSLSFICDDEHDIQVGANLGY